MTHCPECDSESVSKNGHRGEHQRFKCKDCGNSFLDIHVKIDPTAGTAATYSKPTENTGAISSEEVVKAAKKVKELGGVQVTGLNGNVDIRLQNVFSEDPSIQKFPVSAEVPEIPALEPENSMDEMEDNEVGNQMKIGKKVSQKPSHIWLRAHKHDPFDTPQFSKKYNFWFNSWGEYFSKRYLFNKEKKALLAVKGTEVMQN